MDQVKQLIQSTSLQRQETFGGCSHDGQYKEKKRMATNLQKTEQALSKLKALQQEYDTMEKVAKMKSLKKRRTY